MLYLVRVSRGIILMSNSRQLQTMSSSDKMRGTIRPGKAIDGLLLVGQEHPSGALIELMQIIKTSSRPNGVFHHAPVTVDERIAPFTSASKPRVHVSAHEAPQRGARCQRHPASGQRYPPDL
jgi:hypothetical protein